MRESNYLVETVLHPSREEEMEDTIMNLERELMIVKENRVELGKEMEIKDGDVVGKLAARI